MQLLRWKIGPEDKISDIHSSRKQEREEEGEIQNFGSMTACGSEAVRGESVANWAAQTD